jgi:hypothetical protein
VGEWEKEREKVMKSRPSPSHHSPLSHSEPLAKLVQKERPPFGGLRDDRRKETYFFFVSVEVVVLLSVLVVVEVPGAVLVVMVIVSVPVPIVVVVAVVPVSCTTAGAVDSVVVVVSVLVSSFFLQPVASATPRTATRPRVTNFFISLISFF